MLFRKLCRIRILQAPEERELLIQTGDEHNSKFRVLNGHSEEITRLTINTDGTLLASGDAAGKYCIWEISSHQCLKVSTMRFSISTLRFIPFWKSITGAEHVVKFRPVWDLRREPTKFEKLAIEVSEDFNADQKHWSNVIEETIDQMLVESGSQSSSQIQWEMEKAERKEAAKQAKTAENGNAVITLGDDEDDAPEMGSKRRKKNKKNRKSNVSLNQSQLKVELEPEEIVVDDGEEATAVSNRQLAEMKKSLQEVQAENEKLKEINRQMYEFVAKEIVEG